LGQQAEEIQLRDEQISQSRQKEASLQAELERMTDNASQLQSQLDSGRQKFSDSTQRAARLQSEMAQLQERLTASCQLVVLRYDMK